MSMNKMSKLNPERTITTETEVSTIPEKADRQCEEAKRILEEAFERHSKNESFEELVAQLADYPNPEAVKKAVVEQLLHEPSDRSDYLKLCFLGNKLYKMVKPEHYREYDQAILQQLKRAVSILKRTRKVSESEDESIDIMSRIAARERCVQNMNIATALIKCLGDIGAMNALPIFAEITESGLAGELDQGLELALPKFLKKLPQEKELKLLRQVVEYLPKEELKDILYSVGIKLLRTQHPQRCSEENISVTNRARRGLTEILREISQELLHNQQREPLENQNSTN